MDEQPIEGPPAEPSGTAQDLAGGVVGAGPGGSDGAALTRPGRCRNDAAFAGLEMALSDSRDCFAGRRESEVDSLVRLPGGGDLGGPVAGIALFGPAAPIVGAPASPARRHRRSQ